VSIRDGKLMYSQGRDSAAFNLHQGGGRRVLVGHVTGPREGQQGAASVTAGYTIRVEWQSQ
jgi:hypothetical protein